MLAEAVVVETTMVRQMVEQIILTVLQISDHQVTEVVAHLEVVVEHLLHQCVQLLKQKLLLQILVAVVVDTIMDKVEEVDLELLL